MTLMQLVVLLLAIVVMPVFTCGAHTEGGALLQSTVSVKRYTLTHPNIETADEHIKLQYLSMVYNETVSDVELFDKLEMLYLYSNPRLPLRLLPGEGRNKFAAECKFDSSLSSKWEMGKFGFIAPPAFCWRSTDLYESSPNSVLGGVPDFTWLEVTRAFIGWKEGMDAGCWFQVRRGSGVFVNTRKTLVIASDEKSVTNAAGLQEDLWHWCFHARQQGYDSIQVLNMRLDGGKSEFVYCSGRCADTVVTTACVPELELRTGLSADRECSCDSNMGLLNCGTGIMPKGQPTPCELIEQDELAEPDQQYEQDKHGALPAMLKYHQDDAQMIFDFQIFDIDQQALTQMVDRIALPGIWLKWYPWKRIVADILEPALVARGFQMIDVDDEKEPIVSLIDRKGDELKYMPLEMIQADDAIFPITLNLSIIFKEAQNDSQRQMFSLLLHDVGKEGAPSEPKQGTQVT